MLLCYADCGMPPEFCEYSKSFEKCKPWLKDNFPHLYPHIFAPSTASGDGTGAPTDVDAAAAGIAAVSVVGVAAAGAGAPTAAADKTVDDGKKSMSAALQHEEAMCPFCSVSHHIMPLNSTCTCRAWWW